MTQHRSSSPPRRRTGTAQFASAPGQLARLSDLDAELAALDAISLKQMRACWRRISDKPVPRVRGMLQQGGLPRRTEQRLA